MFITARSSFATLHHDFLMASLTPGQARGAGRVLPHSTRTPTRLNAAIVALIVGVLTLGFATPLTFGQVFTFDTDNQGWSDVSVPKYGHVAVPPSFPCRWTGAFGTSPGSLYTFDDWDLTGIASPASIAGNKEFWYGQAIEYDLFVRYSAQEAWITIELNGGTNSIYYSGCVLMPVNTWTHMVIPVSEDACWHNWNGTPVTEQQMRAILSTLTAVYIETEWAYGDDYTNVDNISLPTCLDVPNAPQDSSTCAGGAVSFAVEPLGIAPFTYNWQIEAAPPGSNIWSNLANGVIPGSGASAFGSNSPMLAITNIDAAAARRLRVIVTNACGSVTSNPATLTLEDGSPFVISVDPRGTWLHANEPTVPPLPLKVGLAARSIQPGDRLHLQRLGAFSYHRPSAEIGTNLMGLFSSTDVVLADQCPLQRVPGAIDAGTDVFTPLTNFNAPCSTGRVTDIAQDFTIDNEVPGNTSAIVVVPVGANFLMIGSNDEFFGDNTDANGDFGVRITNCGDGTASVIPAATAACTASTVVMVAQADGCGSSFQWQYDDPNVAGSGPWLNLPETQRIVGTQTALVAISNVSALDATAYRCIVTNVCGAVTSTIAVVTVQTCCPADINHDASVNVTDLITVITNWGACPSPCPPRCAADIAPAAGDCNVNVSDLLAVITAWGACS